MSVVNAHLNDLPVEFSVCVNEGQDKLRYLRYCSPVLDLHLSVLNGFVSSKNNDKRDDFDFDIVNCPFLDGDVPRRASYGVYISRILLTIIIKLMFSGWLTDCNYVCNL